MDIKTAENSALIERRNAIAAEVEKPDADLDALEAELRSINAEIEERNKKAELRLKIASGAGVSVAKKEPKAEEKVEVRNTDAYLDAYANYVRTGSDKECRALLTENAATGTVPVPAFVAEIVKHAWEREGIMRRVKKLYLKGNVKIAFEISGDDAEIHTEGGAAIDAEDLVTGIVEMVPATIKKWVSISDEILDLDNRAFLQYIYDELAYRIIKKAASELLGKIDDAPATSTTTAVGIPVMTVTALSMGLVAEALGNLSDEAENPIIVMNKLTWSALKQVKYNNNFDADPFEGLEVEFSNELPAFSAASTGDTVMIVGDFASGAMANYPAGEGIEFKFDDKTLMTQDLVRILGRQPIAVDVIAPGRFVKVTV